MDVELCGMGINKVHRLGGNRSRTICIEISRSQYDVLLLRVITMRAATFGAVYPASVCRDHSAPEIASKVPLCESTKSLYSQAGTRGKRRVPPNRPEMRKENRDNSWYCAAAVYLRSGGASSDEDSGSATCYIDNDKFYRLPSRHEYLTENVAERESKARGGNGKRWGENQR